MTLTASPTSAAAENALAGVAAPDTWFTTTDHRRIGRLHAGAALLVGTVGTVLAAFVDAKVGDAARGALPTGAWMGGDDSRVFAWGRLFRALGAGLPLFVVAPLLLALAVIALPSQLGTSRLAFPRMAALSLWSYVVGVALLVSTVLVSGATPLDILDGNALQAGKPAGDATDLMIGALIVVSLSLLVGAVNVVATVLTQRKAGLRVDEVAPFAWASFVTAAVTLIATPVGIAGYALLYLDQHFGSTLFNADGAARIWIHEVWLLGRPEAFLLVLPALGLGSQLVANRAGKPLLGGPAGHHLLTAFGVLSLGAWAGGDYLATAVIQPTSRPLTALAAIPVLLLVLLWVGTLATGAKPDAGLLFVVGFVALVGLAAANVLVAAAKGVTDPTATSVWQLAQVRTLLVGAPMILALGGIAELAEEGWGHRLSTALTALTGLAALGGGVLSALGLGVLAYSDGLGSESQGFLSLLSLLGGLLTAGALALTILNLLGTVVRRGEAGSASEAH